MGERALDPKDLLDRLRSEHEVLQWQPLPPDEVRATMDQSRVDRSSLEYLHHHWALPDGYDTIDAGRGLRSRLVALFGRLTYRVLRTYLQEERALWSNLVQTNEQLAQRCDQLSVRVDELSRDMIDRQVAEAENQAKLALWLHLEPPAAITGAAPSSAARPTGGSRSSR